MLKINLFAKVNHKIGNDADVCETEANTHSKLTFCNCDKAFFYVSDCSINGGFVQGIYEVSQFSNK